MEQSGHLHAPATLLAKIKPPASTEQEAGWLPSRSGYDEEKNFFLLLGK
jgi:hypothetical protein